MARTIHGRYHITGNLIAQTPLHVGGDGEDVDSDLPLARNGKDEYYVPGTSLAGAIRAWSEEIFDQEEMKQLWGFQEEKSNQFKAEEKEKEGEEFQQVSSNQGRASSIYINDAIIELPKGRTAEIRDGVGIDRVYGSAGEHIKYDRMVLPRGTRLPLSMTIEFTDASKLTEFIGTLLKALEQGDIRFGAGKTRGLGSTKLVQPEITKSEFNHFSGILQFLRNETTKVPNWDSWSKGRLQPRIRFEIDWEPVGPLMVKAGMDSNSADILPLLSGSDEKLSPVLPGSSIKGAIRTHCERIVRTVLNQPLSKQRKQKKGKDRFLDHLRVRLIDELFGVGATPSVEDEPLGLGALRIDDCYAKTTISTEQWKRITIPSLEPESGKQQSNLSSSLAAAGIPDWSVSHHVAIDRWTGGAAESFLFCVMEPHQLQWDPLKLQLDWNRLTQSARDGQDPTLLGTAGITLLLLAIRDLAQGRLPLGFAVNRGLGSVRIKTAKICVTGCDELISKLEGILPEGNLQALDPSLRQEFNRSWQEWLRQTTQPSREKNRP